MKLDALTKTHLVLATLVTFVVAAFAVMTVASLLFIGTGWPNLKENLPAAIVVALASIVGIIAAVLVWRMKLSELRNDAANQEESK